MTIVNVCVLGGGGFIGRHIVHQLAARNCNVLVPSRNRERTKQLIVLPTVEVVKADVHEPRELAAAVSGMDAVVNLVGVLHGGRGNREFERSHARLPAAIVAACRNAGVPRLLHVSALGVGPEAPSEYLRSKWRGEEAVRAGGVAWSILRPSLVFGPDDRFLNMFALLARRLPVIPLACPSARFQPLFVEDVARAAVAALDNPLACGQTYELGGPAVYTLQELVERVCRTLGLSRPIIPLSGPMSWLQAAVLELLPGKLMTRDNYRSMQVDCVTSAAFPALFGFKPTPLEAELAACLSHATPRNRYNSYRLRAGR